MIFMCSIPTIFYSKFCFTYVGASFRRLLYSNIRRNCPGIFRLRQKAGRLVSICGGEEALELYTMVCLLVFTLRTHLMGFGGGFGMSSPSAPGRLPDAVLTHVQDLDMGPPTPALELFVNQNQFKIIIIVTCCSIYHIISLKLQFTQCSISLIHLATQCSRRSMVKSGLEGIPKSVVHQMPFVT